MKIDVAIEAPRDLEDARDMSMRIAVGIRTAADQVRALLAGRDQQFFGARIVEQAFLREHANLDIDGPSDIPSAGA